MIETLEHPTFSATSNGTRFESERILWVEPQSIAPVRMDKVRSGRVQIRSR